MSPVGDQRSYWDSTGATKTFTHPVDPAWLPAPASSVRVLDYGCGYGRVAAELADQGWTDIVGVDLSPSLVERARRRRPDLRFEVLTSPPDVPPGLGSFDVVLLIAVLTCVIDDEAQKALVAEVVKVLEPGGHLYLSDLLIQDDRPHRYDAPGQGSAMPYGTFATGDGAWCRHHDIAHLHSLFADLMLIEQRSIDVATMNGNQARGLQMLLRKPEPRHRSGHAG